jgi:Ca2+-binding EF-hand superfamily protein
MNTVISTCGYSVMALLMSACATQSAQHHGTLEPGQKNKNHITVYESFSMYDTDNNGYLDRQEFHRLQLDPEIVRLRQRIPVVRDSPFLFEEVDESGDERISQEELMMIVFPHIPR